MVKEGGVEGEGGRVKERRVKEGGMKDEGWGRMAGEV